MHSLKHQTLCNAPFEFQYTLRNLKEKHVPLLGQWNNVPPMYRYQASFDALFCLKINLFNNIGRPRFFFTTLVVWQRVIFYRFMNIKINHCPEEQSGINMQISLRKWVLCLTNFLFKWSNISRFFSGSIN